MATPYSWPSGLPKPQKQIQIKIVNGLSGEADDLYPERNRTNPDFEGSFSFVFTDDQYSIFEEFYKNELNGGCASFLADWINDSINKSECEARFKEPYSSSYAGGGMWVVSVSVDIFKGES